MKIKSAEHIHACASASDLPAPDLPEVAFLGRSNVGKSSLLNRMVARKQLARTSGKPGKTRLIHFYRVETEHNAVLLVDLPGYGWAQVSRSERKNWQKMVESYLGAREPLRTAILLQDLRREVSEDETLLLAWLAERQVPSLVALTKVDKLKKMQRGKRVKELRGQLALGPGRVLTTSAETGVGIQELWRAIWAEVAPPPEPKG